MRSQYRRASSSSFRRGPLHYNLSGQAGDLPVLVQRAYRHARVLDLAGREQALAARPGALPSPKQMAKSYFRLLRVERSPATRV